MPFDRVSLHVLGGRRNSGLYFVLMMTVAVMLVLSRASAAPSTETNVAGVATQALTCLREPCQLTLKKVVTLFAPNNPIRSIPAVVRDPKGGFIVRASSGSRVLAFDASGRFQSVIDLEDRSVHPTVNLLATPTGQPIAWVFPSNRAFTIGEGLKPKPWPYTAPYPPTFIRGDGTMVVAQQIQTAGLLGYPFHLVSSDGRVVRSFGADPPEYRADLRLLMERVGAPVADGTMWSSARGRYVLERWEPTTGKRLARVPVRSSWFVESVDYPRDDRTRPKPIVLTLWERDGLVWTLIRDADANWKRGPDAEAPWSPARDAANYDWVLEVVDPASGTVVATRRFASTLFGIPTQPFVVSYVAAQPGGIDVWMPVLSRKESEQ